MKAELGWVQTADTPWCHHMPDPIPSTWVHDLIELFPFLLITTLLGGDGYHPFCR